MNKSISLLICSLLLASGQALADRPSMSERSDPLDSEMIDITVDVEDAPIFEEMPAEEILPIAENESAPEADSEMEEVSEFEEPLIDTEVQVDDAEIEVIGDVIEIQPGETLPVELLDFPRRGMTMDKVLNELGEPVDISATVGEPPITTWTYADRIVYFEYSNVLHVVNTH